MKSSFFAYVLTAAALLGAGSATAGTWGSPGMLSTPAPQIGGAPLEPVLSGQHYKDGTFTGQVADAYYGPLQVQAVVQNGAITSVNVLTYPKDRGQSRRINNYALPRLQQEVIQAQNVRVNMVSGATLTSRAYLRSLASALGQAQ